MCTEEIRDEFEEVKEEIAEEAERIENLAEEAAKKAEEAAEDAGEEASEEAKEEETESAGSRFIRRTGSGFEVDTNEIEEAFRSLGEKISEAVNSMSRGVSDSLNSAQERANQKKKADKLAKMLPYMEEEEIHEIAEKVLAGEEDFKELDIASLMPFMSQEDCGVLFEKSLEANDKEPGVDGKLYLKCVPYVGEEVLSKLVDRYVEGGFENIRMDNIYPYLSSADVKRIFYYELKK